MRPFCIAFPVLAGKREAAWQFAKAAAVDKFGDLDASEKRLGIPKEAWLLEKTPQGELMLVYFEADDTARVLKEFGGSKHPFDEWFKKQVKDITGVDLRQAPPGPLPEVIGTYGY